MGSDYRNQHYTPKFYLRNFSLNKEGKQIGVFVTSKELFIPSSKLKTQGTSPYFYGKDGKIENALGDIESETAPILQQVISSKMIPRHGAKEHFTILYFVTLMTLRNPIESSGILASGKKLRETLHEMSDGRVEIETDQMTSKEDAIKMALSHLDMCYEACVDLKLKLLINNTDTPFLSSDNPIVKYNQFLEQKKWNGAITGYGLVGLQLFWPLDPTIMLLFYDNSIYKVGDKRDNFLSIVNSKEVDELNLLQFLNCDSLIFCNERVSKSYLEKISKASFRFAKANQPISGIFPLTIKANKDEQEGQLIRQGETECKIRLEIRNIGISKKGESYQFTDRAVQVRPGVEAILSKFGYDQIKKYQLPVKR
ncbi:DUF4238 domain-containing protein [Pseudoflavitalea sp. X16]|uniref:DUF4238 domain-containing protein n=1 Tax=Paraflavitalea devenefica TaxID=2716334 RepID=UPI001421ACFB|nr:DUF4238 domain-containing protein [Paraflavitalea devenefica]NII24329.1 DUF4238 domain-containing protein [Paraflavitalea devenefica]